MSDIFSRTRLVLGSEAVEKLQRAKVAVFGIGGVGGYVVEALARSGVGSLELIDSDRVVLSNVNRQIIATQKNIGQYKTEAAKERIASINPECEVAARNIFFLPETREQFDFSSYDYVVDAIDTVTGKLGLILACKEAGTPIISSMGAGNKVNAWQFEVADIFDTTVCPLARVMRQLCRKNGIEKLKVVYSKEKPITPDRSADDDENAPGSVAFVPSVAGLIIAGEVIKDITGFERGDR